MEVHLQEISESGGVCVGVSVLAAYSPSVSIECIDREYTKRRLGMAPRELPKTSVPDGIPYPVRLRLPHGVRIVSLVAGGMYVWLRVCFLTALTDVLTGHSMP